VRAAITRPEGSSSVRVGAEGADPQSIRGDRPITWRSPRDSARRHIGSSNMNTPKDTDTEARRMVKKEETRRRDLQWARQWYEGHPHCPACGGVEFKIVHTELDLTARCEIFRCKARGCRAHWCVGFWESAVMILREDEEDDWIEFADFDTPQPLYLSERESATLVAALRYWRREGPSSAGHERDVETDNGRLKSLSAEEMEALCERIIRSAAPPSST